MRNFLFAGIFFIIFMPCLRAAEIHYSPIYKGFLEAETHLQNEGGVQEFEQEPIEFLQSLFPYGIPSTLTNDIERWIHLTFRGFYSDKFSVSEHFKILPEAQEDYDNEAEWSESKTQKEELGTFASPKKTVCKYYKKRDLRKR